jgi:hypothetical protein
VQRKLARSAGRNPETEPFQPLRALQIFKSPFQAPLRSMPFVPNVSNVGKLLPLYHIYYCLALANPE